MTGHALLRALATLFVPIAAGAFILASTACGGSAEGAQETIVIRFSKFEQPVIEAKAGEPIVLTLQNDDPIDHEWIVGSAETHIRHRTGTEPYHDEVPTEVTIPALESRTTTVRFDAPGDYLYICHLPGHEAYGMTGVLRVEP